VWAETVLFYETDLVSSVKNKHNPAIYHVGQKMSPQIFVHIFDKLILTDSQIFHRRILWKICTKVIKWLLKVMYRLTFLACSLYLWLALDAIIYVKSVTMEIIIK